MSLPHRKTKFFSKFLCLRMPEQKCRKTWYWGKEILAAKSQIPFLVDRS